MRRHNCRGTGCGWCEEEEREERRAEVLRDLRDGLAVLLAVAVLVGLCLLCN